MSFYHKQENMYVSKISIRVSNIERSIAFYQNVIGLTLHERTKDKATLGSSKHEFLELIEIVLKQKETAAGLYHFAILLPTRKELGGWLQHMIDNQFPIQGASNHGVSEAIYLQDPDGNGVEVYADFPENKWVKIHDEIQMSTNPLDFENLLAIKEQDWKTASEDVLLGHVHLSVRYLDASVAFYHLLGFDTVLDIQHAVFLSSKKYHHHLACNIWNMRNAKVHQKDQIDMEYAEITYPNQLEFLHVKKMLQENNKDYTESNNEIFVHDPNGILFILRCEEK